MQKLISHQYRHRSMVCKVAYRQDAFLAAEQALVDGDLAGWTEPDFDSAIELADEFPEIQDLLRVIQGEGREAAHDLKKLYRELSYDEENLPSCALKQAVETLLAGYYEYV